MYTVSDIMTPVVLTIPDDKLVCEVEGILIAEDISGAPIVDPAGKVVGLISSADIVHFDFIGGDTYTTPATEICIANIVTVESTDSVELAARTMYLNHVPRLLVVDGNHMVGMLTEMDIVKLVADKGIAK